MFVLLDLFKLRVGQGYDVHRLVAGRKLILGGIHIPSDVGLDGHSDADVLLHAIIDAILGATGQGDIGSWFSDSDPAFKDADSAALLSHVLKASAEKGFSLVNVDSSVICQNPRLAPHMAAMHQRLAQVVGLAPDQVNIKAKTNEKLGYLGREEAIEAQACVLMVGDETSPSRGGAR